MPTIHIDDWVGRKQIEYEVTPEGCWECTSHWKNDKGYPKITVAGKYLRMSRFMYSKYIGEIPEGRLVCHRCDNPSCINPSHLFVGTHLENTRDCIRKGRAKYHKKPGVFNSAKLCPEDVRIIRESTEFRSALASRFGVTKANISAIQKRKTWKHID